jgi:ferredoxin
MFTGLQKDWPGGMRNIWFQNILFLAMISFSIILITRPVATAILFIAILVVTLVLSLLYRGRVFCLYVCPVGGFLSTYSMAAMTEIRAIDPEIYKKHRSKSCYCGGPGGWACPFGQYLGKMDRNNYCGLCTECIKSCPKENVGVFVRPFGSDRVLKGYDEMFNVIIMLVVALAFSVTMLGPWGVIKDAANVTESRQIMPFLIYLGIVWSLALGIFPLFFVLAAKGANRLAGKGVSDRVMILRLAYLLIPLGMFSWIAFSLPPMMINYNYILSVLSDPLGLGWNLFDTADYPFKPFYPEWIPLLQGVILLTGLYLGLSSVFLGLKDLISDPSLRARGMILPSLFALFVINLFLKLFLG